MTRTSRDFGRGARYAVDRIGRYRLTVVVPAPAEDRTRAFLDRTAMGTAQRDGACCPRKTVDMVGGRRLKGEVAAPADDVAGFRLDRTAVLTACRDGARSPRNAIDGVGGYCLAEVVVGRRSSPADDVAGFRLDRTAMRINARCDVGRGPCNAVDGIGRRSPPVVVPAPADDVARARLDRAAVTKAPRDLGRGSPNAVDRTGGRRLAVAVPAPADDRSGRGDQRRRGCRCGYRPRLGDCGPDRDGKRDNAEGPYDGLADGCVRHGSPPYAKDSQEDTAVYPPPQPTINFFFTRGWETGTAAVARASWTAAAAVSSGESDFGTGTLGLMNRAGGLIRLPHRNCVTALKGRAVE